MRKSIQSTLGIVLSLVLILGLTACAGPSKKDRSLQETMRAYEHSIRWSRMENINNYLKEPIEFSAEMHEKLKHIQVTSYRLLSRTLRKNEINQLVEIQYYHDQNATVRTITDAQKWEYDEEEEAWFLISKPPKFK
ncbi:MAG: hypothetical protein OQK73_05200 [Gammaproteobacteria bacterium]|nr:hypothetical protein [Gammaproteobacteria bacterium]